MLTMKSKQKVLLINSVCGQGSTGKIVIGLYDALEKYGYTCMIAYGRGEASEGYTAYRIGTNMQVNLHGAMSRITDRHGYYSVKATRKFLEQIKEFDPDIIHLHNIHGYYLNIPMLFSYLKETNKRVIWTLHDCWAFTGHCTHFDYIGCNKWQTKCFRCEQLKEYPKSIFMDRSLRNFSHKKEMFTSIENMAIVTPSQWLSSKVADSFLGKYKIKVIATGIDLEQFSQIGEKGWKYRENDSDISMEQAIMETPILDNGIMENMTSDYDFSGGANGILLGKFLKEKLGLRGKRVLLGVSNPWRERKGLQEFEKLARLIIDDRYKIVLVGLKDKQLKQLPKTVVGIPKVNSTEEMAAFYAMADIYVNLTLEDTFPTTNIEALACGTPVITYRAGGSPESLDETCGIVIERKDIQGVVTAIDTVMKALEKQKEVYSKDACMVRAKNYTKETKYEEYVKEVYFDETETHL